MGPVQLFAVQARVDADTYASSAAFAAAVRRHAATIASRRVDGVPALAVWPEMFASFLPLAGRRERVSGCSTTDAAMRRVALAMPLRLARTALRTRPRSFDEVFVTAVAEEVWHTWWSTFAAVAAEHEMWVVAGSALMPINALGIGSAAFEPASARFYNTSLTFAPDGSAVATTRKVNAVPTQEDVLHMSTGDAADLSTVETPFGTVGTLICYDGFREAHTSDEPGFVSCAPVLDRLGVDIVAQPSANAWPWDGPWAFNDDGENLLRSEQWFAEGLYSAMAGLDHVRFAVNPQLVGRLFDLTFEAPSLILERTTSGVVEVLARSDDPTGEDVLDVVVEV